MPVLNVKKEKGLRGIGVTSVIVRGMLSVMVVQQNYNEELCKVV